VKYKKVLNTLIDVIKGITAGLFVASLVALLIQENNAGWLLFLGFIIGLFFSVLASILYEWRYPYE